MAAPHVTESEFTVKLSFLADTTATDVASISANLATVISAVTGQPVYPGANPINPSYLPGMSYGPPISPLLTTQTTFPLVPMLLGGAAGYAWKKSALAGLAGVVLGYFLGNAFQPVTVAGAILPNLPVGYPYNCPPGAVC